MTYDRDTRVIVDTIHNGEQPGRVLGPDSTLPYVHLDHGGACCYPVDRIRPELPDEAGVGNRDGGRHG